MEEIKPSKLKVGEFESPRVFQKKNKTGAVSIYERNKVGFKYLKENGKQSLYFPDFKLQDGRYIEVKGYETDLDRCKWRQFPYTLIILRKFEIENLNKLLL